MESAEEFMKCFFSARTEDIKKELERREPFRKRYFAADCLWESLKGNIERSESEVILAISKSDDLVEVITQQIEPFRKLRYILLLSGENWLIERVDFEHPGGKGWVNQETLREELRLIRSRAAHEGQSSSPKRY